MNPRIMILISVIALLCMFFLGVNLFLQGKGIMFLLIPIAMAIFIFMAISTVPGNDEPQIFRSEPVCLPAAGRLRRTGAAAGSAPESAPPQQEETLSTPYAVDFRLTSGHHTAGIDFPAGVYDLEAIQWCGTVTSSNDAISPGYGYPGIQHRRPEPLRASS